MENSTLVRLSFDVTEEEKLVQNLTIVEGSQTGNIWREWSLQSEGSWVQTGHCPMARSCSGFWMRVCEADGCHQGLLKSGCDVTWGEQILKTFKKIELDCASFMKAFCTKRIIVLKKSTWRWERSRCSSRWSPGLCVTRTFRSLCIAQFGVRR